MSVDLSIIIPCYNDKNALENLLLQITNSSFELEKQNYNIEIMVVDGNRSDECAVLCSQFNASYIYCEPCRGLQLLKGSQEASGTLLWFLHADAEINTADINVIRNAYSNNIKAGYFRFSFAGKAGYLKNALATLINLRTHLGGVPYGDQGIFVESLLYKACNGHSPFPLFEEVNLVRILKKNRKLKALPASLKVNPRRWENDGYFKRTFFNRIYALAYMVGISPFKIAKWYQSHKISQKGDL